MHTQLIHPPCRRLRRFDGSGQVCDRCEGGLASALGKETSNCELELAGSWQRRSAAV
ncbi:hypothetical protein CALCODRAFT_490922 [Calocera cornea HHB12733]|uniref:Uncharacterized protein n=1 Tax=Calocera cornea HHB12733 TaxID=1353952 RepID=A0A165JD38_9BASI|nr:hypothetical protein CALCODRAFT_490922 [Calocera cornea HHB12733]